MIFFKKKKPSRFPKKKIEERKSLPEISAEISVRPNFRPLDVGQPIDLVQFYIIVFIESNIDLSNKNIINKAQTRSHFK